jgi:hypothetical protein
MSKFIEAFHAALGEKSPEEGEDEIENSQDREFISPDDDEEAVNEAQSNQEQLATAGRNSSLPAKVLGELISALISTTTQVRVELSRV